MGDAFIIDACRTPRGIGKVGKGALADFHPQHLGAAVLGALRDRNDLKTEEVDDIIWGCSSQRGKQGGDMGRMSALTAGYDIKASGGLYGRESAPDARSVQREKGAAIHSRSSS